MTMNAGPLVCSHQRGAGTEATAAAAPSRVFELLRRGNLDLTKCERERLAKCLDSLTDREYLRSGPGQEHYALLEWLGCRFAGQTVLDFGTYRGASALALSASGKADVVTVDCADVTSFLFRQVSSICHIHDDIVDWLQTDEALALVQAAPLIVLDVSHDGWTERAIYAQLERLGFVGILLLDDINLNDQMRRVWAEISRPKLDLSSIGHHTGTGIVLFEGSET